MKCHFCGKEIEGMGNSCRGLIDDTSIRCCDECNMKIIIPARFYSMMRAKERKEGRKESA